MVATPGRLEDLLQRRALSLEHVRILVIDEADRMLDMGFKPAVDRIVARTPRDRQTLFFSATLEAAAGRQARAYTRDARRHVHEPKPEAAGEVSHRFVHLSHQAKVDALVEQLRGAERGRTLVFVRTKRGADRLVKRLGKHRVHAVAMHGNKSQAQRQKALGNFAEGQVDTLVATDVAARGLGRRRCDPRDQLRRPWRSRCLCAPRRPDGPCRSRRHGHQLHPSRRCQRDAADRRQPRPLPRVRPRAPQAHQRRQRRGPSPTATRTTQAQPRSRQGPKETLTSIAARDSNNSESGRIWESLS